VISLQGFEGATDCHTAHGVLLCEFRFARKAIAFGELALVDPAPEITLYRLVAY
jgi:hypothetical protein